MKPIAASFLSWSGEVEGHCAEVKSLTVTVARSSAASCFAAIEFCAYGKQQKIFKMSGYAHIPYM
jgi:hypothetical protein